MAMAASGKRRSFYADLDHLRSHFDSLDQDKTGYIGYSELKQLVQKMSNIEEAILPELMEKLDRDKDGKVSFDDFQALFEVEGDTSSKKIKVTNPDPGLDGSLTAHQDHDPEILVTPVRTKETESDVKKSGRRLLPETPTVVLRNKPRSHRRPPATDGQFGFLSPIPNASAQSPHRPLSNEYPDLATQMQHLTGLDTADSPQIKRRSRVLSWISESGDLLFEDTGDGVHFKGMDSTVSDEILPSPPMSPVRGSDEASHVADILESVLHSKIINKDAIAKLCAHVKADPQEKEELLTLLDHLDKKKVGHVMLEEFVAGLQNVKNSAQVASTPFKSPPDMPLPRRHTFSGQSIPRLSEPFTPTHTTIKLSSTPFASTPTAPQPTYSSTALSVLDPDNSGYVKVDSLIGQIQLMGVDTEHDTSLEEVLAEAVTIDPTGRVSVTELTSSLEGAILTEGKTNNFLRQIALKSFKSEINSLRTQVHQVSLERDNIRSNLNRTLDENKKLVQEGEDHVDMVTKQSERKLKEQEYQLTERLKETERTRQEEASQMQDRVSTAINAMQENVDRLKGEEEKLRADLKLAHDEVALMTGQLSKAYSELNEKQSLIAALQRDLGSRSELDFVDDEHQLSHLHELENELTDKGSFISELQEKLRETQDRYDLLTADNEKLKQKYLSAKRESQRRKSSARLRKKSGDGKPKLNRPLSGMGRAAELSRQRLKRPLSGSYFGRTPPTRAQPPIFKSPLDLAIGEESNHPVLFEDVDEPSSGHSDLDFEPISPAHGDEVEEQYLAQESLDKESSDDMSTPTETTSGDDDVFSRSSTSLMEEIHTHEQRSALKKRIGQLEQDKALLEANCQLLEQQIKDAEEGDQADLLNELERTKKKQEELDRLIHSLAKQSKRLSKTRMEIDSKLEVAEQSLANQLQGIHGLRSIFAETSVDLIEELETTRNQLETERKSHEVSIASLKEQLSRAEEFSDTQTDQSLKLEEEKALIEEELLSTQHALESERRAHEAEVNILTRKLDNAEQSITTLEASHGSSLQNAKQELERAYAEVELYKQEMEALRSQLNEIQDKMETEKPQRSSSPSEVPVEVCSTEFGIQVGEEGSQSMKESEADHLRASLADMQDEYRKVTEHNERLQTANDLYHTKMLVSEQSKEAELSAIRNQLSESESEIKRLTATNKDQETHIETLEHELHASIVKAKEQLAEASSSFTKTIESSKAEYESELEKVTKELKDKSSHEKELEERLARVGYQYENTLTEVAELTSRESNLQEEIENLKKKESQYKQEISVLKSNIEKHQDEIVRLQQTDSSIQRPTTDLEQKLVFVKSPLKTKRESVTDFDEPDYVPAPILPKRPTYSSKASVQEEIISQMKSQLEDLQKILVHQSKGGTIGEHGDELSMVKELLAGNEALENEARRAKQALREEQARLSKVVSSRDQLFSELQSQMNSEKIEAQTLALSSARNVFSQMSQFEKSSHETLSDYKERIETAATKLSTICTALKDRDDKHSGALEDLISDLDHSRVERDGYREEIDRLKQELDESQKSYEDLNQSKDAILELQRLKQAEVEQLHRHQQAATESENTSSQTQPLQSTSEIPDRRRVDEESGQIFHNQGDAEVYSPRESALLKRQEEEIHELKDELDRARRLERQARSHLEEVQCQMTNKDQILQSIEEEAKSREIKIQELESELQSRVNEAVESVVQYVEVQPLEAFNEALLLSMSSKEAQKETVKEKIDQDEIDRTFVESSQDNTSAALAEALQEAEQKLLVSRQIEHTLKMQHEQALKDIESKHEAELAITNEVIDEHTHDLRELYMSVVGDGVNKQKAERLTHSQLINELRNEVLGIQTELKNEQAIVSEMEATLNKKMEEHEELESQIQTEHEEEVMALRQQKQQLHQQLEDAKMSYYRNISEQDQRNNVLLQDLVNAKSTLEKQLQQKKEESLLAYQQVADLIEEKKVLMDIVEQLCVEAGKQINVV